MKIISWNINGIRAIEKKGALDALIEQYKPDILFLMETKATIDQLAENTINKKGYRFYLNPSQARKGHSGTGLYIKENQSETVTYDETLQSKFYDIYESYKEEGYTQNHIATSKGVVIEKLRTSDEYDEHLGALEGRLIVCETNHCVLVGCYFPNGGDRRGMNGLQHKLEYYDAMQKLLNQLSETHKVPVILIGDINVAHEAIDLARPESNKHSVGFLPIEREKLNELVTSGWVDIFRMKHPNETVYSWWDQKTNSRERNVGWRIDAVWAKKQFIEKMTVSYLTEHMGSDHCPVLLKIS